MRLKKFILAFYLILLGRNLFGQQSGINSHIFNVTPNATRSTVGQLNFQDLQNPAFSGGWIAPNTWLANNLRWKLPTNDFEGCFTSDGSLNTAWNKCAHVVMKNLGCPAASASATHYTCSTENTFTPATADGVLVKFDVVNNAGADLAVNGASALPIVFNTTLSAITASAVAINTYTWCVDDGTHWQCMIGLGSSGIITINGQSCALGGTCNVNAGDTAHGFALNEGNGNQLGGLGPGSVTNQIPATVASADPVLKSFADLSVTDYVIGGGAAQTQTAVLINPVTALTAGLEVHWLPVAANTGAGPTLGVNGLTPKTITKFGTTALVANDLTTTAVAVAIYDGTEFQLQNPQTAPTASTTVNGQTCALGGTCNVNVGASAHSIALDQGNGNAMTGLLLGAHQVPVGTASSDPNAKTIANCLDTAGQHINFDQSTDSFICGTSSGGAGSNFADMEVPTPASPQSAIFTLAHSPSPALSLALYVNGVQQIVTTDFTLSTNTITFTHAPSAVALLIAFYRY